MKAWKRFFVVDRQPLTFGAALFYDDMQRVVSIGFGPWTLVAGWVR